MPTDEGAASPRWITPPPPIFDIFELEDMPEEVDLDHLGPSDGITKEPVIAGEADFEESRCSSSDDHKNNNNNNNNNNSASKDGFHAPARASAKGTESPLPPDNRGVAMPGVVAANGCLGNGRQNEDLKTEEEKIQEYLQRSDTAVIYPEPVDGEGESTPENTVPPSTGTDEVPSEGKGTSKDFYLKCPHCDKVIPSIEALRSHLVAQHGASEGVSENGYACDKCNATFVLREQLEKHELLHSPTAQVVECKVCHKTFANVYRLQRHMISHDESAVLRKFKCPECEKAFKFKHHLKEHIRIHSGEKPFACPNCGKRFSHSGSYSSHMTSKKCLVVNLKVRRTVDKPLRTNNANSGGNGTGSGLGNGSHGHSTGRRHPQGTYPPILPKYGENGLELSQAYGGSLVSATGMSPEHFALDFSHPSLPAFMPPYPLSLHPLMNPNHYQSSGLNPYALTPPLASLSHMIRPSAMSSKSANVEDRIPSPSPGRTSTNPHHEPETSQALLPSRDVTSPCSVSNAGGDLNAVKKILATVNATVSRQQQQISRLKNGLLQDIQSSTSPIHPNHQPSPPLDSPPPIRSPAIVFSVDLKKNGFKGDDSHCRYCGDTFQSKIDLHQHERYLCKLNRDIQPVAMGDPYPEPPDDPPPLTSSRGHGEGVGSGGEVAHATFNGLSEPDDDNNSDDTDSTRDLSDDTVLMKDGRKVRMRSLITDECLSILRAHYDANPRPSKEDIHRIAGAIKFPPRVVQVWFQNMRARDKKRGRTFREIYFQSPSESGSMAALSPPPSSALSMKNFTAITSTPYPPLMPSFNGGGISSRLPLPLFYSPPSTTPTSYPLPTTPLQLNGHCSSPFKPSFSVDHEQPLDLSFKSNPRSAFHRPETAMDEECEVLNLSQKSSRTSTPSHESNNNHNELRVQLVVSTSTTLSLNYNTNSQPLHSHYILTNSNHAINNSMSKTECKVESSSLYKYHQREEGLPTPVSISPSLPSPRIENSSKSDEIDTSSVKADIKSEPRMTSSSSPPPLETPRLHQILATPSSPSSEPVVNGTADSSGQVYSTDGSHSPCPSDEPLEIDEAANTPNKRCWKQMEGEESQLELDDSSVGEDDRPQKRRKSWKQHKLDSEEGMYACDQCDKMFSKQSSLARHKYEHSGQRPHKCEVCGKAFKHKHHLTEHKRLHSGEKPFQCNKCMKRFSHSGSYSQHMNHRYSYCKPYRD